jgi:membrane associated rhomboid family serine protease
MNFRSPYGFHLPVVTKNLLIINILMYFLTFVFKQMQYTDLNDYFSLHHHLAEKFKPYQWLTHMFMHANARHLFSNMFGLLIFGKMLEDYWGQKRFVIFYVFCGLAATIPQYIINHREVMELIDLKNGYMASDVLTKAQKAGMLEGYYSAMDNFYVLGASGALYGILGGVFYIFGNMPMSMFFIPVSIPLKYIVTLYMILEITGGLRKSPFDNVAHFAHIGGLIAGMVMVLIWERKRTFHS